MVLEAVCLASGPSLSETDIELVRQWRNARILREVIVCNTTFRSALWADVVFGMDSRWWKIYANEVKTTFKGEPITSSQCWRTHGIAFSRYTSFGNSGAAAVHLAYQRGARRIILLGYDCGLTGGKSHHHGPHPRPLHDALSHTSWPDQFRRLADALKGKAEIINSSRESALTCWPRMPLEDALAEDAQAA